MSDIAIIKCTSLLEGGGVQKHFYQYDLPYAVN